MRNYFPAVLLLVLLQSFLLSCDAQVKPGNKTGNASGSTKPEVKQSSQNQVSYKEGKDYVVFERVRVLDKIGFNAPQEAYSLLLPKGWKQQAEILWNMPGSACAGTYGWLQAGSPENNYKLEVYPDLLYSWTTNEQLRQFNQQFDQSSNCRYQQPMDAADYFRNVFVPGELGNPQIVKITPNNEVVKEMQKNNNRVMSELRQYGAGEMNFYQSAINAEVKWADNTEGMVILGVSILENLVPNNYTGTYDKSYTMQVMKRTVYRYPASEKEQAMNQFAVIMGSVRTNSYWSDNVNSFWKQVRQQKHITHLGTIAAIDERTRQIGNQAIKSGQERLKTMDLEIRNWEAKQNTQDNMHTQFIKTIREVENFRDETGTYEMTSSYSNAWSRGDGNSFVMSNNPNLDPGFIFKDQQWKPMKKVE